MEQYKSEFIDFMVESDVLKFGEFTLKSGRKSPFFMNAGAYVTGSQLKRLGQYYAKAIHDRYGDDFDVLFGPAYKGIPLSVVTAIAYSDLYGKEIRYCSDRKEEKDHGADKGSFLGSKLKGRRPGRYDRGRDHLRQIHGGDRTEGKGRRRRGDRGPDGIPGPYGGRQGRREMRSGGSKGSLRLRDQRHCYHGGRGGAPLQPSLPGKRFSSTIL